MSKNCVDCRWIAKNFDPPLRWWQFGHPNICRNPRVRTDPVDGSVSDEKWCDRQRVFSGWPGCCNREGSWFERAQPEPPK